MFRSGTPPPPTHPLSSPSQSQPMSTELCNAYRTSNIRSIVSYLSIRDEQVCKDQETLRIAVEDAKYLARKYPNIIQVTINESLLQTVGLEQEQARCHNNRIFLTRNYPLLLDGLPEQADAITAFFWQKQQDPEFDLMLSTLVSFLKGASRAPGQLSFIDKTMK